MREEELGEYLRGEGLYYAIVKRWQKEYTKGDLGKKQRGRKKKSSEDLEQKIKELEKAKKKLEKKLKHAETIIEFQKKIAELLEKEE